MNLIITQENAQIVLNYLATRPFNEVHKIAPLLINLPKMPEVASASTVAPEPVDSKPTQ